MSEQPGNPGCTFKPGQAFKFPDGYKPGEFLYKDQGPWPSVPGDKNPCKMAPEVLNCETCGTNQNKYGYIPYEEWENWNTHLKDYYLSNSLGFAYDAASYGMTTVGEAEPDFWLNSGLAGVLLAGVGLPVGWKQIFDTVLKNNTREVEGSYPTLDDTLFTDLIAHGLLSKLLSGLDTPDESIFKGFLNDNSREYWKNDATHMRAVRSTDKDEYIAPAIVLLSRPKKPDNNYNYRVDAIALFGQEQEGGIYNQQPDIFTPADGKAWQLAKYFALQGVLIRINLVDHPMVHFPSDTINAITKTALPMSNLVFQLLLPHFELSLPVDNSVLEGDYSLINRTYEYPYSPYPAIGDEIRNVFPFYWSGSDYYLNDDPFWVNRTKAFPKYSFELEPRDIPSRYGEFMNAFYEPILKFTSKVVQCIPDDNGSRDWAEIRSWADYVASWIPGFPDGETMTQNPDILAKSLAYIIWNAAIVHSLNHYLMHDMFERGCPTPYIIREEPPAKSGNTDTGGSDYRAKALVADVSAARFCDLFFFMPHNTVALIDCVYGFDKNNSDLMNAVKEFKDDLSATAERLHKEFPEFGIKMKYQSEKERDHQCFGAGVQY